MDHLKTLNNSQLFSMNMTKNKSPSKSFKRNMKLIIFKMICKDGPNSHLFTEE